MPDILAIAATSLSDNLQQLEAISRNVANLNTQAYQREIALRRGFDAAFSAAADSAAMPVAPAIDVSAGPLQRTGSPLNIAIEGSGYFQLQTDHGVVLTRDGRFQLDRDGRLVALDGTPVLLQGEAALNGAFTLGEDGTLRAGDEQAQLDIVAAAPDSLQPVAPGRYRSDFTTVPEPGSYRLRQGYLEGSNVDYLREMVELMTTMRSAQSAQQVIHAYDEVIQSAVSTLGQF